MIDAHQHFWRLGEADCTWPTADLPEIYRDFLPEDLAPIADAAGISGTVLVQSQESNKDTDFLLQLADQSPLINAVVGWVDLASPQAVTRIEYLGQHPKMRGLRPMLQSMDDDSWILNPVIEPAIYAMQEEGLSLDALVFPRHIPYLRLFARRHPTLPIVIDHGAKPNIAGGDFSAWADAISAMAELPQVYSKLSGLLTEANAEQGAEALQPYVMHLYREFGAHRLMWGSDWPVLNLAPNRQYVSYADWLHLAKQLLAHASADDLALIFDGTARHFYRI